MGSDTLPANLVITKKFSCIFLLKVNKCIVSVHVSNSVISWRNRMRIDLLRPTLCHCYLFLLASYTVWRKEVIKTLVMSHNKVSDRVDQWPTASAPNSHHYDASSPKTLSKLSKINLRGQLNDFEQLQYDVFDNM